jgi:ATP-dependent DNA ligase
MQKQIEESDFMHFDEFANYFIIAFQEQSAPQFVEFLLTKFPWGNSSKVEKKGSYWTRSDINTSNNSTDGSLLELKAIIYLCQGRFGVPYIKRQIVEGKETDILGELQKIQPVGEPVDMIRAYNLLHDAGPKITNWLDGKSSIPSSVVELASVIHTNPGRICLARILLGPLVDDSLIISFLCRHQSANTFSTDPYQDLRKIYRTTLPDLGLIAQLFWEDKGWDVFSEVLIPGLPTKPEELQVFNTIENAIKFVWKRDNACYVQPKYYGWQIQIHKSHGQVWIFGRNLDDLTKQLSDLVKACNSFIKADSAIFDGELIDITNDSENSPTYTNTITTKSHQIVIFDVLQVDGKNWRAEPYQERRKKILEILPDKKAIVRVAYEQYFTSDIKIREAWHDWLQDPTYIGVVVKLISSEYISAGLSKGKWKVKNYLSLDLAIIGYRVSAKGNAVFMVGALDEKTGKYVPVGDVDTVKASVKTNQAILEQCKNFITTTPPPNVAYSVIPRVFVNPRIVIEVITTGQRIVDERYFNAKNSCLPPYDQKGYLERPDKSPDDVDKLSDFLSLKLAPKDPERFISYQNTI